MSAGDQNGAHQVDEPVNVQIVSPQMPLSLFSEMAVFCFGAKDAACFGIGIRTPSSSRAMPAKRPQ